MKTIVGIILLWFGLSSLGLSQTSFEFDINSEEDCIVIEAATDENGEVVLVGLIGDYVESDYDAFIMRVQSNGTYTTERFDRQDTLSRFTNIEILPNGNYFVLGCYSPFNNNDEREDLWVAILDSDLNIISEKSFKAKEPYDSFSSTACTVIDNDGNIVLTTGATIEDKGDKQGFLDFAFFKFTPEGDTIVSKYYSYIHNEVPYELKKVPNSDNFMLIEQATALGGGDELFFFDTNLDIIKINTFTGPEQGANGNLSSDGWISDNSFLVSGKKAWDAGGYWEHYIGVYLADTSGQSYQELVLDKLDTLDYTAWKNSMAYANDTTIYIGGFQNYLTFWTLTPSIVELYVIDKNMNVLGYKELGGDACYELRGIIATEDDGCLLYGTSYTNPDVHERDIHIWKVLREDIELLVSVKETSSLSSDIKVFPNPVQDKISIDLGQNHNWEDLQLSITSIEGKTVFQKQINEKGNLLEVDLSNLTSGLFIIQISNLSEIIYSEKIVKQ